jgi:hypothetical protein
MASVVPWTLDCSEAMTSEPYSSSVTFLLSEKLPMVDEECECRARVEERRLTLYANLVGPTDIGVANAGLDAMWSSGVYPRN